jgi:hypothetical protein
MHKRTNWSKTFLLACLCALAISVKAQTDDAPAPKNPQGEAADAAKQLTDRDPLVRQRGAEALARLAATDWLHLTEGYRLQEKNARVRLALDWAIYRMGKDESLYAVVRALDSAHDAQAAGYLAQLETPQPLYAILPRVNGNTQIKLLKVFARIGDAATLEQIKPYADSFDPLIAAAAHQAEQEIEHRLANQPTDAVTRPRQVGNKKPPAP